MKSIIKDTSIAKHAKKRKCLYHPAMKCPSPDEPCIFKLIEETQKSARDRTS